MITPEQVDIWRSRSENARLEFKEAKQTFSVEKLFEYCVAIANSGGGHLVLGVSDKPPRLVVGTAAIENPEKCVFQVRNKVGFQVDIEEVNHADGRVVVVVIPARPKGTAYNLDGRFLIRVGESLVCMTEDRLRQIFDEGKPDWLEEVSRKDMTEQEIVDTLDTQTFFELLQEPFPTTSSAILERLVRERLLNKNGDRFNLLRIGGILLARQLADFPDISRKAARVVVYTGSSKIETKIDQIGAKGYAVGFSGLVRFIMSQLPQNEIVEDALRKEVKMLPEIAIRELVANAMIHQDFAVTGTSVMIEIYSNRVVISNPGEPIVNIDRFIDGYRSRNERLADLMRRMRICEEKGSGVDKVIHVAEVYQLPAPDFRAEYARTSVVLAGPKPFDEMGRDERIRACYQHAGLKRVTNDYMTNQSLRERFHLPDSKSATISQVIAQAVDAGLVKADESVGSSLKLRRYLPFWA